MKTIIQTPTPNLKTSVDFYTRLEFELLSEEDPTLLTDGKFIIEINPERFARAGLKLYSVDWSAVTSKLARFTNIIESPEGFTACDPNGVWVYLQHGELSHSDGSSSNSVVGNFAGVSIEALDIEKTVEFWSAVGFEQSAGEIEQGWATFSNGSSVDISLMTANMCPHLFFNPGLTFFNSGDNLVNIRRIREAGIAITEEITHFNKEGIIDNVIINDPGGLGFFVFND